MPSIAQNLTVAEFEREYSHREEAFEYWDGKAIAKAVPTWIHGLLQRILMQLLSEAGLRTGSEVELRIVPGKRPRPDIVASNRDRKVSLPYPTEAFDYVIEILSDDDDPAHVREKCEAYAEWGFEHIVLVDSRNRSVVEYRDGQSQPIAELAGVPVARIWQMLELDLQ